LMVLSKKPKSMHQPIDCAWNGHPIFQQKFKVGWNFNSNAYR
jgi:hypothetical protein